MPDTYEISTTFRVHNLNALYHAALRALTARGQTAQGARDNLTDGGEPLPVECLCALIDTRPDLPGCAVTDSTCEARI